MSFELAGVAVECSGETHVTDAFVSILSRAPAASRSAELVIEVARGDVSPFGESAFFFDDIRGAYGPRGVELGHEHARVAIDAAGRHARVVVSDPRAPAERLAALTLIFALACHGVVHVHAAAVVGPRGAVLLAGGSGSGKSTSTIALLRAGLRYLGDDATLVFRRDGVLRACGLPCAFHATSTTLARFPDLDRYAMERVAPSKLRVDDDAAFPGQRLHEHDAPRSILFPVVRGTRTEIVEIAPADALGRLLATSAWCALPGAPRAREHLDTLARLIDGARTGELTLAPDVLEDPRRLASILDRFAER